MVRSVLLRDYPFRDPAELVQVGHQRAERGNVFGGFSPQDVADLRKDANQLSSVSAYFFTPGLTTSNMTRAGDPLNVATAMMDGYAFQTLGVSAARGRTFGPADDVPGANQVAVVSYAFWRGPLGADPSIVGTTVHLDGKPFQVIGVLPRTFAFPSAEPQVYVPLSTLTDADVPHQRGVRWLNVIAREAPGATLASLQAQVGTLMERLARDYPESNEGWGHPAIVPLTEYLNGDLRLPLLALLAAVGLVLLIACVNIAHLMLARGLARTREMAIRSALGASPKRLLGQLLLESSVLALASALAGLLLAWAAVPILAALAAQAVPRAQEISIDPVIAGFSLLAGVGVFLVVGILPAVRTVQHSAHASLREGRGQSAAGLRLADALVAAESGLAMLLLAGSALALTSLWRLTHADPGFRAEERGSHAAPSAGRSVHEGKRDAAFPDRAARPARDHPGSARCRGKQARAPDRRGRALQFSRHATRRRDRYHPSGRRHPDRNPGVFQCALHTAPARAGSSLRRTRPTPFR